MANLFFDTSALVKRYISEIGSAWVIQTCEPTSGNFIFIADITAVELASAFTRRVKGGSLTQDELQEALARFDADLINELLILEIGSNLLADARRLVEIYALRAYDAVQLAIGVDFNRDQLAVGLSPITWFLPTKNCWWRLDPKACL